MMFSVGMGIGIGLMFWGVAEPIYHFDSPPHGQAAPRSLESPVAMKYSYFHWALHPWTIYAVVGLAIAYFTFRKGKSAASDRGPSSESGSIIGVYSAKIARICCETAS